MEIQSSKHSSPVYTQSADVKQALHQLPMHATTLSQYAKKKQEASCCMRFWKELWRVVSAPFINIWKGITIVFSWCCCCGSKTQIDKTKPLTNPLGYFETIKNDPAGFRKRYETSQEQVEKELVEFIVKDPGQALSNFNELENYMKHRTEFECLVFDEPDLKTIIFKALHKAAALNIHTYPKEERPKYLAAYRIFYTSFRPTKMRSMTDPFDTLRNNPVEIKKRYKEDSEKLGTELMEFIVKEYDARVPEFQQILKTLEDTDNPEFENLLISNLVLNAFTTAMSKSTGSEQDKRISDAYGVFVASL